MYVVTHASAIGEHRAARLLARVPRVKYQMAAQISTMADAAFERIVKKLKKFAIDRRDVVPSSIARPTDSESCATIAVTITAATTSRRTDQVRAHAGVRSMRSPYRRAGDRSRRIASRQAAGRAGGAR